MVAAMGPRQLRLLLRADRADDGGAEMIGPLAGDEADAAGRGMEEDRLPGADFECLAKQILRGEALQRHRRCRAKVDARRDLDQPVGGDQPLLRIGAVGAGIGDAVAGADRCHARADGDHHARSLASRYERQRRFVDALAVIDVDEVQPDRLMADARLARPRRTDFDVLPFQHFGSAEFTDDNRLDHFSPRAGCCLGRAVAPENLRERDLVRSGSPKLDHRRE
jgi:hypothetical protein